MPTPRKSQELHELAGTKSQARSPAVSSIPEGRPSCPRGLSREARKVFRQLCRLLAERKTLTRGDGELLVLYAETWDRRRRAQTALLLEGEICTYTRLDSNGRAHDVVKTNLNLPIVERADKAMVGILDRLGLTPLGKDKVKAAGKGKQEPVDPMETFLARHSREGPILVPDNGEVN
jgi:P27 family predicted phage terminase small subunit